MRNASGNVTSGSSFQGTGPAIDGLLAACHSLYSILLVPRVARWVVTGLLIIHSGLLVYLAYVESPTFNEPAHLVSGLSHWKYGRFDLYRVNPPLVRMVAALPVIAAGYEEDWSRWSNFADSRSEMPLGEAFVEANDVRSIYLLMIARWACIPFSCLGAIVCYLWARDLYGRPSGILACAIWCFEPNILAHGSLITPDAHATSLGVAACYTFWRWLISPTWGRALMTGVVLGLAELTKTTLIVFYPLWPLMWLIYRWPDRQRLNVRDWTREAVMLAFRMLVGLYVLNLGYAFEGSFQQLSKFHFVSALFADSEIEAAPLEPIKGRHPDSTPHIKDFHNRFASTWLGGIPVPLPENYLKGIDLQQRDFEAYQHPSYLRGEWSKQGWWYYYFYAVAIKVPLGLWALGLLVLISRSANYLQSRRQRCTMSVTNLDCFDSILRQTDGFKRNVSFRDEFVLLLPGILIFAIVSSKTGFSEHMRYVLPSFPYFFVAISQSARWLYITESPSIASKLRFLSSVKLALFPARLRFIAPVCLLVSVCWLITSSLWLYPHSLSYFNELVGGPQNGWKHLLGSNVDWGQGLMRLNRALDANQYWGPVAIAYYGPASPEAIGSRAISIDWTRKPSPLTGFSHVAISANILAGDVRLSSWCSGPSSAMREFASFFRTQTPVTRLDGSLLIFESNPYVQFCTKKKSSMTQAVAKDSPLRFLPLAGLPSLADPAYENDLKSVSGLLHAMILYRLGGTELTTPQSGLEALRILTDEQRAKAALGASPFIRTRHGLRYRLSMATADDISGVSESHRDQCLATFAALDIPLAFPVVLDTETQCLQGLLSESIANFTFDQREMSWTATAYAHYLPPAQSWTDRFGRTTTFSELLRHIMNGGFAKQSCAGLHVLQSVIAINEADCRYGILDSRTRVNARRFIDDAITDAIANQRDDGSWDYAWHRSLTMDKDSQSSQSRLIVTGHLLEQMHALRNQPSPQLYLRATRWLLDTLRTSDIKKDHLSLCPLTHGLRAVQLSFERRNRSYELEELFHRP